MENPVELSHICAQSLRRARDSLAAGSPADVHPALSQASSALSSLCRGAGLGTGSALTPWGAWSARGSNRAQVMDFFNTAALPAASIEGVAGVAAAAAAAGAGAETAAVSPREAARFDAELEESIRVFNARAAALLAARAPPR